MGYKLFNLILLFGIAILLETAEGCGNGKKMDKDAEKTITYTIWSPGFSHTTVHTTKKEFLYDMMIEINDANRANFSFAATHYGGGLGYSITEMVEVHHIKNQVYWMVGRMDPDFCFLNLGASSYKPKDGEHIKWKFLTLAERKGHGQTCR